MEEKPNLFQKIQLVSNEIKNIEKNLTVGKGNYAYKAVQDIDVTLEVKEAESKHGLVSIPIKQELVKSEIIRVVKEGGGESINYMDIIKMTLRMQDIENLKQENARLKKRLAHLENSVNESRSSYDDN